MEGAEASDATAVAIPLWVGDTTAVAAAVWVGGVVVVVRVQGADDGGDGRVVEQVVGVAEGEGLRAKVWLVPCGGIGWLGL